MTTLDLLMCTVIKEQIVWVWNQGKNWDGGEGDQNVGVSNCSPTNFYWFCKYWMQLTQFDKWNQLCIKFVD